MAASPVRAPTRGRTVVERRKSMKPLGTMRVKSLQRDVAYYTEQERLLLEQSNELQDILDRKAAARR